jgi:hypothetical protein
MTAADRADHTGRARGCHSFLADRYSRNPSDAICPCSAS